MLQKYTHTRYVTNRIYINSNKSFIGINLKLWINYLYIKVLALYAE